MECLQGSIWGETRGGVSAKFLTKPPTTNESKIEDACCFYTMGLEFKPGQTWCYLVKPGATWSDLVLLGQTWCYLVRPGAISKHVFHQFIYSRTSTFRPGFGVGHCRFRQVMVIFITCWLHPHIHVFNQTNV